MPTRLWRQCVPCSSRTTCFWIDKSFLSDERRINNHTAQCRSVCVNLLLLGRFMGRTQGVDILTGEFNKGSVRQGCRLSPLVAAFGRANVPWPTSGGSPSENKNQ